MHPSVVLLMILVAVGAASVRGHATGGTAAERFWEEAFPGTQMPEALVELVQKGIHHSPLAENYTAGPFLSIGMCLGHVYVSVCSVDRVKAAGTGLFFHEEQLRVGSAMTVSFSAAAVPAILPHDDAVRTVPFGNLTIRDVTARFHIAPGSTMAAQLGDTLRTCQVPPPEGHQQHAAAACAVSIEDTVRAAMRTLGGAAVAPGRAAAWVAASAVPRAGLPLQPYAVEAVTPLGGGHHVACHDEPFPYAVFRCHRIGLSMTKAYAISLRGLRRGGPAVTMAVICHLDTSGWNPGYPAFAMLGTKPGDGSSVCHFMPYANLLFGVKAADAMANF